MSISEIDLDLFDDESKTSATYTRLWNGNTISTEPLLKATAQNRIGRVIEKLVKASFSESCQSFSFIDPKATISPRISWNAKERSRVFEIPGKELSRGQIGGINGIGNLFQDAVEHAELLSKCAGNYKVEWVYNCSHSALIDIAEAVLLNYKGVATDRQLLRKNWIRFHEQHLDNPDAKYLQFCHSKGTIPVKFELSAMPKEIRNRIIVVALAPAAIIPKSLCFESYNYVSKRDAVPYGELITDISLSSLKTFQDLKDLQELIILDPHPDAPVFDHAFNSPTFEKIIIEHIEKFLKNYGAIT